MRVTELAGQIKAFVLGWIDSVLSVGGRDLGSPSTPFGTIYAESITADEVLGTLSGAEWEHTGNMVIDANSASDTTVSVVNQGTGAVDFSVEGDILVTGTVDGVDVAALDTAYDAHVANVNAHHNQQHSLDGSDHTGTLSWAKVSKTGSSLADLATRAHSALTGIGANDHHNQSHVLATNAGLGADHTMSGATAGHVLRASSATAAAFAAIQDADLPSTIVRTSRQIVSGAGLTGGGNLSADRTLAVGAGAGITVNADDVALTTPGSLSATSTNSASGSHTHAIDSTIARSAIQIIAGSGLTGGGNLTADRTLNVGAGNGISVAADSVAVNTAFDFTWTGDHVFTLHTEFDSADFDGAVNVYGDDLRVYNASDLTTPVLYVDVSTRSIGVNRDPDPQFDVDVAGALRAAWLVGPHAIQLSDAELICHYDGPGPYETDFTGTPQGHRGQVATITGGVVYRPGKFGKAAQCAEATTNLCTNPSFETNTTGWSSYATGSAAGSRTLVSTQALYGSSSYEMIKTAGAATDRWGAYCSFAVTSGITYTLSAWVKVSAISGGTQAVRLYTENPLSNISTTVIGAGDWRRLIVTTTATSTGTGRLYIWIDNATTATIYLDGVQVEAKAYATPYCDGSLGSGHSWSGTAHATSSSRTVGYITYPTANISESAGTVMAWVYVLNSRNNDYNTLLRINGGSSTYILLRHDIGTRYRGQWGSSGSVTGGTAKFDQWVHLALTYDGTTVRVYENGVEVASGSPGTAFTGLPATLYVGAQPNGSENLNGYIDELVILSRAADADEIRAIYESNAPVFAESAVAHYKSYGPTPVEINEEGLFVSSVATGDIFAVYGGGATKSWGGLTLGDGDVLIGRNPDGYVHWDDSADTLNISAQVEVTGDSTITGNLSITSGNISYKVDAPGTPYNFLVNSEGLYTGDDFDLTDSGGWASFVVAFESQSYGSLGGLFTMGVGDVFIGDANGGANVLWDSSAGQLLFRDGTDTEVYIDTDGSLVTGDGRMRLNSTGGLRIEANTSVYNGVLFYDNDIATRLTTGGLGAYSDTVNGLAITTWFVSNVNNGGNPARIQLEAGDSANKIVIGGILNFEDAMGNSSKNPAVDAATDWVECQIGGVTRYIPVYTA